MNLKAVLEGILFVVGEEGISLNQIKELLEIDDDKLKELVSELSVDYADPGRGITLKILGNNLKLTTKEEHRSYYEKFVEIEETELSQAALETLAIIAYNEPVTRITVDEIRGVSSREIIRKLVAKGLVKEVGRSDMPGRPILYKTTSEFLDYFGISSKEDLPKIDTEVQENIKNVDLYNSKYVEEETEEIEII